VSFGGFTAEHVASVLPTKRDTLITAIEGMVADYETAGASAWPDIERRLRLLQRDLHELGARDLVVSLAARDDR
jgi:hypothetical protein